MTRRYPHDRRGENWKQMRETPSKPDIEARDYNGPGEWGHEAVCRRYIEYARLFGQEQVRELKPNESAHGNVRWVCPVMDEVIVGIAAGDLACIELGVEFIESDHKQPFGRILHSNAARELRRAPLTEEQRTRLRKRILQMLVDAKVPHEYHEYAKLLRRVGLGNLWAETRNAVDEENPYVMRYVRYYEHFTCPEGA